MTETNAASEIEYAPLPTTVEVGGKRWSFRLHVNELCDIETALDKGFTEIAQGMLMGGKVSTMRQIARHAFYELDGTRPSEAEAGLIVDAVGGPVIRDAYVQIVRDFIRPADNEKK